MWVGGGETIRFKIEALFPTDSFKTIKNNPTVGYLNKDKQIIDKVDYLLTMLRKN